MSEALPFVSSRQQVTIEEIRHSLGSMLVNGDVNEFTEFRATLGHIPVWVDDPTGHYPLRRHRISQLRAVIGYGLHRVFWRDEEGDTLGNPPTGREFAITPDNLIAITRVLSEEDIE